MVARKRVEADHAEEALSWSISRAIGIMGLAIVVALGPILLLLNTPWGLGVGYDSVFYLSAAQNALSGLGLSRLSGGGSVIPLTHFPPLYPLLTAALAFTGLGTAEAARWLAASSLGANVALIGFLVWHFGRSIWVALGVSLTALASPVVLDRHLAAMSEPVYFFWLLSSLGLLAHFFRAPSYRRLLLAAASTSLAYLTRYAGVSLLATGVLALLLLEGRDGRRRFKEAGLFAGIAVLPSSVWVLRNLILTGTATNRVIRFHPVDPANLRIGAATLGHWILPHAYPARLSFALFLIILAIGGMLLMAIFREPKETRLDKRAASVFSLLLALHLLLYALFLVISLSFFDASTRLTDRILSPMYVVGLVLLAVLIASRPSLGRWAVISIGAGLLWLALVASYVDRSVPLLREIRLEGRGFNSQVWRNSQAVRAISQMPSAAIVYTNQSFPVYHLTGKAVYGVPERVDPVQGRPRQDYEEQLALMRSRLAQPGSALVIFHPADLPPEAMVLEELTAGLLLVATLDDGVIYVDPRNAR